MNQISNLIQLEKSYMIKVNVDELGIDSDIALVMLDGIKRALRLMSTASGYGYRRRKNKLICRN